MPAACSPDSGPVLRRQTVLHGPALTRAALAAYNCGLDNLLRAVRYGLDLDFYTAGRDYSREPPEPRRLLRGPRLGLSPTASLPATRLTSGTLGTPP